MSPQERLAQESIQRWGFVVVKYERTGKEYIGETTMFLWKRYRMPQPFTVIREATMEEWQAQVKLFREVTGQKPHPDVIRDGVPYILITVTNHYTHTGCRLRGCQPLCQIGDVFSSLFFRSPSSTGIQKTHLPSLGVL